MRRTSRRWGRTAGSLLGVACGILMAAPRAAAGEADGQFQIKTDDKNVSILLDGKPVLRYRFADKPIKPYVSELYLPDGLNIVRDSPPDHKHHHGLMFAWNVDGVEFWGEDGKFGRQLTTHLETHTTNRHGQAAVISQNLDWVAPDGETVLLREKRTIEVYARSGPADRLLTWTSEFAGPNPQRDVTITGRTYLGLGVRFPVPMDRGARFMTSFGQTDVARVNGCQAPWCAITGNAAPGRLITFAMFDDPRNPRAPSKWFAMNQPFAYISATIGLEGAPFVIKAGQKTTLRYGVAAWSSPVDAERVAQTYRAWEKLCGARR
jgi:hypothetical protein